MKVYLDNNATTMIDPQAFELMKPFLCESYGNPNSLHQWGSATHKALGEALDKLYAGLHASENDDIVITSCATESINWVLKSVYFDYIKDSERNEIIISGVEHPAVRAAAHFLESLGVKVIDLPINSEGLSSVDDLKRAISNKTALVSIMWANNETGMIFPIEQMVELTHEYGALFHSDATQAVGKIKVNLQRANVDFASFSAHKFHGPKGTGVLYARTGVVLSNIIEGGAQERGKRAGTENLPAIAGMAVALDDACAHMSENAAKVTAMRDKLIEGLSKIPHSALNGDPVNRLPGNVSFCFEGVEGESLLLLLDQKGISASSGSACTSGSLDPSHVLLAIGRPHEVAHGSLRLSISEENTMEQMDYMLKEIPFVVDYLRKMSPLWLDKVNGKKKFVL